MLFESSKFSFFLVIHLLAVVETNLKKTRRLNALNNTDKDNTSLPINNYQVNGLVFLVVNLRSRLRCSWLHIY